MTSVDSAATLVSYDQVPYLSGAASQSHPSRLAVLPILFGQEPRPIRTARILELGCASGNNLIPMAHSLPEAEFVGVDLSARQIADGQSLVDELRLSNVDLRHASILDVDQSFGQFDFIICHGVYSWVPRQVQDKILQIGASHLAPHGVCYVSYNTYPGWHLRGVIRDMMQYHVASFGDPHKRIQQARLLLDFLNRSASHGGAAYRQLLADEAEIINQHSDSYLFHEHLEEVNEPLYFHEFVERAEAAGLAYLGDASFYTMLAQNFDEETAAILDDTPLLRQEQYMDFLRNRRFRSSVLCHKGVRIDRNVSAERLAPCHVALAARLTLPETPLNTTESWEMEVLGSKLRTAQPVTKATLAILNESWPARLPVGDLQRDAAARLADTSAPTPDQPTGQQQILLGDLMILFSRGILQAWYDPPSLVAGASEFPKATRLARLQAQRGESATNQWHESVRLEEVHRAVLSRLDGTRDRDALADWLAGAIARGEFHVRRDDTPLTDVDSATITQILDTALKSLSDASFLIS